MKVVTSFVTLFIGDRTTAECSLDYEACPVFGQAFLLLLFFESGSSHVTMNFEAFRNIFSFSCQPYCKIKLT